MLLLNLQFVTNFSYSNSIVNEPLWRFNINGLCVGVSESTMQNTMFRNYC